VTRASLWLMIRAENVSTVVQNVFISYNLFLTHFFFASSVESLVAKISIQAQVILSGL
jgi:hypothetical protein